MDDAAVVLHILEFVLLGRLHVDHRVLVDVFLEDHRLKQTKGNKDHQTDCRSKTMINPP